MSRYKLTFFEYDEKTEEWIEYKQDDLNYDNIEELIQSEFPNNEIIEKEEKSALIGLSVYNQVRVQYLQTFLVCPECDSNKMARSAIKTKQIVQRFNDKIHRWYTIEESEDRLHSDSYIYYCEDCEYESEELEDFEKEQRL